MCENSENKAQKGRFRAILPCFRLYLPIFGPIWGQYGGNSRAIQGSIEAYLGLYRGLPRPTYGPNMGPFTSKTGKYRAHRPYIGRY